MPSHHLHTLKVDLNLGHIRLAGTAAVLGWPRYGDICEGSGLFCTESVESKF